ncbi:uncharacterized protein [Branchiostoma lanceolatum]|uniref:uncharacterized protein isoform X2 n=1 Tax=Branchiostoma lanceolatum TaxID=7740 RepID=UPI003454B5B7
MFAGVACHVTTNAEASGGCGGESWTQGKEGIKGKRRPAKAVVPRCAGDRSKCWWRWLSSQKIVLKQFEHTADWTHLEKRGRTWSMSP